jgi:hypothetical protein
MKHRYAFLFAVLVSAMPAQAREPAVDAAGWSAYRNERFGFSFRYPADIFAPERASAAGDGQIFSGVSGHGRLLVGAFLNSDRHTPKAYQQFVAKQSWSKYQVTYSPRGENWFVLSGEGNDGETFYEKVMFSCGGSVINSFALIYPTARRATFDPIVEGIENSFRPGTETCSSAAAEQSTPSIAAPQAKPKPRRQRSATSSARRGLDGPRSALADRIARERGEDVIVIMRRQGPPYDTKAVRGYVSR